MGIARATTREKRQSSAKYSQQQPNRNNINFAIISGQQTVNLRKWPLVFFMVISYIGIRHIRCVNVDLDLSAHCRSPATQHSSCSVDIKTIIIQFSIL